MKTELTQAELELTKLRRAERDETSRKQTLDWLYKDDSEPVFTEDFLFDLPLPEAWKLNYIVESKMNNQ